MECINNFMGNLNISISGIGRKMLETWHWQVFDNGGKKDSAIKLTKKKIWWSGWTGFCRRVIIDNWRLNVDDSQNSERDGIAKLVPNGFH